MINDVCARVTSVSGFQSMESIKRKYGNNKPKEDFTIKKMSYDELKELLKNSIKKGQYANPNYLNQSVGYFPSEMSFRVKEEENKGFFQKVYEQAMRRINQPAEEKRDDVNEYVFPETETEKNIEQQKNNWVETEFPTIAINLPPDGSVFDVPAVEHIPYFMNSIEVLPSGLVKFEETVVVIANGVKLQKGLTKILPKQIFNSELKSQKLNYTILGVTINGNPIDYHISSNQKSILLVPEKDYYLNPGVYTYKFEYLVDNLLWEYDDFYRFYWDVGGNGWNLIVDRLGASLYLPEKDAQLGNDVLIGSPNRLLENAVDIFQNGPWATGYISRVPLFIGEGMHIISDIKKSALLPPSIWQQIIRFLYGWSDVCFAVLGFIAIFSSLFISWIYIKKSKSKLKIHLNKSPVVMRYLLTNKFDKKSVCGFLLDLCRRNIVDIQQNNDNLVLIKKTDKVSSLKNYEIRALKKLFPVHETIYNLNKNNMLPFRRFVDILQKGAKRQKFLFHLRLNLLYVFMSIVMLLLTELFICSYKVSALYVFTVLTTTSFICFCMLYLSTLKFHKWLKILLMFFAVGISLISLVIFSAVVHPLAALFLVLSIIIMVVFFNIYSGPNGLVRQYVEEAASFKEFLIRHHENIVIGKDFQKYQPLIFALDLEGEFADAPTRDYNKLSLIERIIKLF